MFEIKENFKNMYYCDLSCPFRKVGDETFDDIFTCELGVLWKNSLKNNKPKRVSWSPVPLTVRPPYVPSKVASVYF